MKYFSNGKMLILHTMKKYLFLSLSVCATTFVFAQKTNAKKSASDDFSKLKLSRWSLGLQAGTNYTLYDIPMDVINFNYGAYLRYSFSHAISFRVHYSAGMFTGSPYPSDAFKVAGSGWYENYMTLVGGHILANIGSISFRRNHPKTNFYLFAGLSYLKMDGKKSKIKTIKNTGTDLSVPLGLGIKFKLSEAFDLGLETSFTMQRNDNLDLFNPYNNVGYPDFFGYGMLSLGYNFTGSTRKQHVDWHNPVDKMYNDLSKKSQEALNELKKDADGDGVPDLLDQEPATKLGYKVDLKGKTLDTDNDGIPDTEDPDPYGFQQLMSVYYPAESYKAGAKMDVLHFDDSIPQVEFIQFNAEGYGLPVITFPPNKYDVHVEQYPLLQQIARIMMVDSGVYVAVIGHADNNKPDMTQMTIAEKRALAVKRQLMKIYEIESDRILVFSERDPFVKKYKMKTEGLDRKVEFRLIRRK